MNFSHLIKPATLTLAAALVFSTALPVSTANAGGKHTAKVVAAGIIGLALGAVAVDASRHHRRVHRNYHYQPAPVYTPPVRSYTSVTVTRYPQADYYQPVHPKPQYRAAPRYHNGAPKVVTYENARVNVGPPQPWSNEWFSYCRSTYRSFDRNSGTFMGYDGRRHFCIAK